MALLFLASAGTLVGSCLGVAFGIVAGLVSLARLAIDRLGVGFGPWFGFLYRWIGAIHHFHLK
jgi:hypothetical protein